MHFALAAGAYLYRPLKIGVSGWDVYALQKGLSGTGSVIAADGVFGRQTEAIVKSFQTGQKILADGVAGITTQRHLADVLGRAVRKKHHLPSGLAYGVIEGESGFQLGSYTTKLGDGKRDVGVCQEHVATDDASLARSFDAAAAIERLGTNLRGRFEQAKSSSGKDDEFCWRYGAVLAHNWPAASEHYIKGDIDTWVYWAGGRSYRMRDKAQWIIDIGVHDVETGYEWSEFYINSKCAHVHSWKT